MTFAVIATFVHLMIPVLEKEDGIYFIKRKGPKAYFYYQGDMNLDTLTRYVKKLIAKKLSPVYVVECYGMYRGMMDFSPYLPEKDKNEHPYYNNPHKELSDAEVEAFLVAHHLNEKKA